MSLFDGVLDVLMPPGRATSRTPAALVQCPRYFAQAAVAAPKVAYRCQSRLFGVVGLHVRAVRREAVAVVDIAHALAVRPFVAKCIACAFSDRLPLPLA